jgi:hypothetical protein
MRDTFFVGNAKEGENLRCLGVNGRIILTRILGKLVATLLNIFMCLRMGTANEPSDFLN